MMIDNYVYIIVALLPITSIILVFQKNPYNALVLRAILGAIAALVYAILGGADVALTEALVGTMLAITLYAIAVRSSLVMRLGIVAETDNISYLPEFIASLKKAIYKHHLRLELVEYPNEKLLKRALNKQEVHASCIPEKPVAAQNKNIATEIDVKQTYNTTIRVFRLFEILQTELNFPEATLNYLATQNTEDKH